MLNYETIQAFSEQYNNQSNIVNFHKNNTTIQVYRYTNTFCLLYNRNIVRRNNDAGFWIVLKILMSLR